MVQMSRSRRGGGKCGVEAVMGALAVHGDGVNAEEERG